MLKTSFTYAFLALILAACLPGQVSTPAVSSGSGSCGDGTCSGPENSNNCPADCPVLDALSNPDASPNVTGGPVSAQAGDAPLFMTTMTHMEGNFTDDQNEQIFMRHVEELRYGMDLAGEFGAILTIESEKPFARANTKWDLNIMAEIQDRGFGVGTHCDIGYNEPVLSVDQYAAMFTENKSLVDVLIGEENNLGCSGGGSINDWALAASQAGFKFLDGIVAMHYLSMPIENRPSAVWTDEYIRSGHFHLNAPIDMDQRIYPFELANARDFVADQDPVILVSSGELGLLSAMAEEGREVDGGPVLQDDEYTFDNADIDKLVSVIREVDASRDRSRIAKLSVYLPANAFQAENEGVLRYFFEQMRSLEQQGLITWASQRQVYEAYKEWND